jgi:hypothetical protein
MSQLLLAYKYIYIPPLPTFLRSLPLQATRQYRFIPFKGLTTVLLIASGIAALVYLSALYVSFATGISLQQYEAERRDLVQKVLRLELSVSQAELNLAHARGDILQSMERVSALSYIPSDESVAISVPLRAQ